jgi:hypothetical protein
MWRSVISRRKWKVLAIWSLRTLLGSAGRWIFQLAFRDEGEFSHTGVYMIHGVFDDWVALGSIGKVQGI